MSADNGFFAIDARIWAQVTTAGMNEAVVYLVLARGKGHNNKTTSWSATAVSKYAGIGWHRAKDAIMCLIASNFIRCAESHTRAHPRYQLATYPELLTAIPPANLDLLEKTVLSDLRAGKQPIGKTMNKVADKLFRRGLLRSEQGLFRLPEPVAENHDDHLIWLPNTIIEGTAAGEESPLQRLRSAGCIWTLRLFVDLYSAQNLWDDGGISPQFIFQKFERLKAGQQGAYTVWAFKPGTHNVWWRGPLENHRSRRKLNPEDEHPIWPSLRLLETTGLLSYVPHVFENDTEVAEPLHAYGIAGQGEIPVEREIGTAANRAGLAMCLPERMEEAIGAGFCYFCPVVHTKPSAQMIGVARLTYRPHTRRTANWVAGLHEAAPRWVRTFTELAAKAETSSASRSGVWRWPAG
jgi:hypothetical protein